MRGFSRLHEAFEAAGARVAGVSADSWAALEAFQRDLELPFELWSDWPERETMRTFGIEREAMPAAHRVTIVLDAAGIVRALIDDEKNMEAHPEGALEAVQALIKNDRI